MIHSPLFNIDILIKQCNIQNETGGKHYEDSKVKKLFIVSTFLKVTLKNKKCNNMHSKR